ncbi:hypothetical protein BV898_00316 [Hypsibius exemplaris]|uniref:CRIB domain-containing protein n=1 Tax=Hypsibius exemplaris TaxID=2072580 RepID=A0A1W0XFF5_HYPEX|nr:hypothetical protein BV898_00316 [Hypsibius exemplaris]
MATSVRLGHLWRNCCGVPETSPQQRIDRSMIGFPTDFRHVGHIGSTEVGSPNSSLSAVQTQMQSKGGYDQALPVNYDLKVRDVER